MSHHVPPRGATNTTNQGSSLGRKRPRVTSVQTQLVEGRDNGSSKPGVPSIEQLDRRALKRQMDRERYASLTQEQNTSRSAKAKDNYHPREARRQATETPESFNETDHAGKDWLHSTDSYIRRNGNMPESFNDEQLHGNQQLNGSMPGNFVQLPDDIMIGASPDNKSIDKFIDRVFPNLHDNCTSATYMRSRAILSTKSEHVDAINALMIDKFPGEEKVYYSFDSDDTPNNYLLDYLNSITPNGLPPHKLKVKNNCPIILLCDLDPRSGLCKGARLVVTGLQKNVIMAESLNGQHAGTKVFIPRILMSPTEDPFKFKRKQFPIRLGFAMTSNKA